MLILIGCCFVLTVLDTNDVFEVLPVDNRYRMNLMAKESPAVLEQLAEPLRYKPNVVQILPMPFDGWAKSGETICTYLRLRLSSYS